VAKATALITGASGGIGAELAKLCAAAGNNLVLVARRAGELDRLAGTLQREHGATVSVLPADLADPGAPQAIFQSAGPVDILINNAGFGLLGAFSETDWQIDERMLQVNIVSLTHLTKLYLPGMIARRVGRILNVASTGAFVPGPFMAPYYASKAFVFSFSLAIASELEGTGVTVTALCPGPTATNFGENAGNAKSNLFRKPPMSPADVAREGFAAMMAGKPEVIAGSRNRWLIWSLRFAPRSWITATAKGLNSPAS
jgi:short-subunit dehydrogenase